MKKIDMQTIYSVLFLPFLIILLLVTSVNGSEDWVEYGMSKGDILLFNKDRITHKTKDIVQVWTKLIYSNDGREKYIQHMKASRRSTKGLDKLSHTMVLYEIDCKKKMYRTLSITNYDKDGIVLFSHSSDKPNGEHIIPDSIFEALQKYVCK